MLINVVRFNNNNSRFIAIKRCFIFNKFDIYKKYNCDKVRRLIKEENLLRLLKFLLNSYLISKL